jgi:hypothetical protein
MLREIDNGPAAFRVECAEGCCAMEVWNEDADEAVAAWTRRAPVSGFAAGVEAAAKVCEGTEPPYLLGERPAAASSEAQEIADQMYKHLSSVRATLATAIRSLTPEPVADVVENMNWSAARDAFVKYAAQWGKSRTNAKATVIADIAPAEIVRAALTASTGERG